ncbi:MAG: glycosyltransferase, partial [Parvularculaceae bacterium]|nr:glycosyltransferase [Parvularculaceae bacterium]
AANLVDLQMRPPPKGRLPRPKSKRVVMFATSQFRIDPRVEREARALAARGFEVVVVGPDVSEPPLAKSPIDWGRGVSFHLLGRDVAHFMTAPPYFQSAAMVQRGLVHDAFAYQAHDLWTALIALDCAARAGAYAVMDFHEWTAENVSFDAVRQALAPHPPERADAFAKLENISMRMAAATITVNDTIARALEEQAGLAEGAVSVIRNIPKLDAEPTREYPPLKTQLGLSADRIVVLYQGGTGPSRLLEPIIGSLAHLPPEIVLVIRGPSLNLFGEAYQDLARKSGVHERLILKDAVPSRDVVAAAKGADIGIWSLPDLSKNFRYALPNKIFEYLAAGLPIAVADYPEPAKIVNAHACGATFDPYEPKSIAAALGRMLDPATRAAMAANTQNALKALDAGREWDRFADLYDALWAKARG